MSAPHPRSRLVFALALGLFLTGACMSSPKQFRGRMIDIGGRNLRMICEGPKDVGPTVVFEAGAFGTSADWGSVQEKVSGRMRTCAYDRAGLGLSDPGPPPRDSAAIVADLRKGLAAAGEKPPYLLAAHSMGPVHAYLHAGLYPQDVVGMVIVDGGSPHMQQGAQMTAFLKRFRQVTGMAPLAARLGVMAAVKGTKMADPIGLEGLADQEKRNAFASPRHNYWAAQEVKQWPRDMELAQAAGDVSEDLPLGVVLAGPATPDRTATRAAPAKRSKHGYYEQVEQASHASVLGPRFNDAIVRAIDHVRAAAAAKSPQNTALPRGSGGPG